MPRQAKRGSEVIPTQTSSIRLPLWQCEILKRDHGSVHAGMRAAVDRMIADDLPVLEMAPAMLRMVANQIEHEQNKAKVAKDAAAKGLNPAYAMEGIRYKTGSRAVAS